MGMDGCFRLAGAARAVHEQRRVFCCRGCYRPLDGRDKWRQWAVHVGLNYAYIPANVLQSLAQQGNILVFDEDHLRVAVVQHVGQLSDAGAHRIL